MKKQIFTLFLFALLLQFSACDNEESLTQRIENLEQMMIDSSQSENRKTIMLELANVYQQYAAEHPKAKDATDKLLKAAQNYGTLGDFDKSTAILKSIIETKPKTNYAKDAMFQIAYIYGEMAKFEVEKSEEYNGLSKQYYEMLVKDFPNDPLAEQSRLLMNFVGKSDDELLEEIIKKNKE